MSTDSRSRGLSKVRTSNTSTWLLVITIGAGCVSRSASSRLGTDSDGDGVADLADEFPADPREWRDSDGDGVGDNGDAFPLDVHEVADSDGDGTGDNADECPLDADYISGPLAITLTALEGPLSGAVTVRALSGAAARRLEVHTSGEQTGRLCLADGEYYIVFQEELAGMFSWRLISDNSEVTSGTSEATLELTVTGQRARLLCTVSDSAYDPTLTSVGWNYVAQGPMPGSGHDLLGACSVSGMKRQHHWNNHAGNQQSAGEPLTLLADNRGRQTTVNVAWTLEGNCNCSWSYDDELDTPDEKLMHAYTARDPKVVVTGIPTEYTTAGFDLYIYLGGGGVSRIVVYEGTETTPAMTVGPFSRGGGSYRTMGSYVEYGTSDTVFNVVRVSDLRSDTVTFALEKAGSSNNLGFCAFQIVQRTRLVEGAKSTRAGTTEREP